jgi:hypothetical protein
LEDARDYEAAKRRKMIKPAGMLVDLDWKKKPMPFDSPVQISFSEDQAANIIKQAGFRIESV